MARVALLGPAWPYRGGIAHFQASMTRALDARGHQVSAVTFSRQYPEALFPGTTQFEDGPPPADLPLAPRLIDSVDPRTWVRTARHVADAGSEVAVLQFWMPFMGPAFGVIARRLRKRGVRVVAVVHNAIPHERRPGDRALSRYGLSACDGLIVLSDQVRADLGRLGLTAPVRQQAHPAYDTFGDPMPKTDARDRLGLAADVPIFLFFGFIRRYKGLHVLLDAWADVRRRVPEAVLVVAGEFYADEAALRAQIGTLEGVRLDADYIPDDWVGLYVSAADAVVQPYVTATQSGVAQIAFHFERPVVTTDVGGLAEIVPDGEAGMVVPPEDPDALADALVRFVEDDLGEGMEEGVRRARQATSWAALAEAVEDLAGV